VEVPEGLGRPLCASPQVGLVERVRSVPGAPELLPPTVASTDGVTLQRTRAFSMCAGTPKSGSPSAIPRTSEVVTSLRVKVHSPAVSTVPRVGS
jgi:hypothetical protein